MLDDRMRNMDRSCAADAGKTQTILTRLAVGVRRLVERMDDGEGFRAEQKQRERDRE
jgi:hypothetical protein